MPLFFYAVLIVMSLMLGTVGLVSASNVDEVLQANGALPADARLAGPDDEDRLIAAGARSALLDNEDTRELDVRVESSGGMLRVTGRVPSPAQGETVLLVASAAPGVKRVESNMAFGRGQRAGRRPDAPAQVERAL